MNSHGICQPAPKILRYLHRDFGKFIAFHLNFVFFQQVKSFMNSLPREKVPSAMNPEGVAHFNSQLAYQNPKQDGDPSLCKTLKKEQEMPLKYLYMTLLEARGTGFIKISDSNTNVSQLQPIFMGHPSTPSTHPPPPPRPAPCSPLPLHTLRFSSRTSTLYVLFCLFTC